MWFELKGDSRLGRCDSEGCGGQPTWRLEAGGVGSNYCSGCKARIEATVEVLQIATKRSGVPAHCQTCGRTDGEYMHTAWTCSDPWHADAHLRRSPEHTKEST